MIGRLVSLVSLTLFSRNLSLQAKSHRSAP